MIERECVRVPHDIERAILERHHIQRPRARAIHVTEDRAGARRRGETWAAPALFRRRHPMTGQVEDHTARGRTVFRLGVDRNGQMGRGEAHTRRS